jgi:hypothetical protein
VFALGTRPSAVSAKTEAPSFTNDIVRSSMQLQMFSNNGARLKSPLVMRVLRTLGFVRLDGRRQVAVTAHYISTFFDINRFRSRS